MGDEIGQRGVRRGGPPGPPFGGVEESPHRLPARGEVRDGEAPGLVFHVKLGEAFMPIASQSKPLLRRRGDATMSAGRITGHRAEGWIVWHTRP